MKDVNLKRLKNCMKRAEEGEELIRFDIDLVKKHGYSPEILVIFTELPEGKTIKTEEKHIAKNDKMAEIV